MTRPEKVAILWSLLFIVLTLETELRIA